ncbi:diacylglycerol/lipid kinase family protein [Sphingosinicella humi]|uniref:diacylglycerol/lipid kinase family protein n=1 Tax=Allosphingosinicella humi TaxID=2068657 RepID=UPI0014781C08|nr:YegS/Rv2252/BmrU family lipid kinase [Sphingosinicella humi]
MSDAAVASPLVGGKPVPKEAVLVVNAHSRKGRELLREAKEKLEAAGIRLSAVYPVRKPKDLIPTMRKAVASGTPMVIVGGGDGSLSCTVDDVVDRDCVFALLPLGTANSFARTLGIPLDLDGAIETIATGRRRRIDLGVLDGDYFANCAAIGLSPLIGEGIPHKLKKYLGRVGYLVWATWCLVRFRPFKLTIDDGRETYSLWATEVRLANGGFHGGVELVETAEVDNGEIVAQVVMGRSKARLIWDWFAKYWKLPTREATTQEFWGERLRIDTKPRMKISIDGEVLAKTPATVAVAHKAIEVVVPQEQEAAG